MQKARLELSLTYDPIRELSATEPYAFYLPSALYRNLNCQHYSTFVLFCQPP